MLSKIINVCGNIFTYCTNWAAKIDSPYVTYSIITACTIIHFSGHGWAFNLLDLVRQPIAIIGSLFTHPTFEHLLGNSLFLMLFGPDVERYLGHFRYLYFFIICGIMSAFTYSIVNPTSLLVGASGAISGIMAIYPFAQKRVIAKIMTGLITLSYFYIQLQSFIDDCFFPLMSNVAHLAHLVGAICGLILLLIFKSNPDRGVGMVPLPLTDSK